MQLIYCTRFTHCMCSVYFMLIKVLPFLKLTLYTRKGTLVHKREHALSVSYDMFWQPGERA